MDYFLIGFLVPAWWWLTRGQGPWGLQGLLIFTGCTLMVLLFGRWRESGWWKAEGEVLALFFFISLCITFWCLRHQVSQVLTAAIFLAFALAVLMAWVIVPFIRQEKRIRSRMPAEWSRHRERPLLRRFAFFALAQRYFLVAKHHEENMVIAAQLDDGVCGGHQAAEAITVHLRHLRFRNVCSVIFHEMGTTVTVLLGIPALFISIIFMVLPVLGPLYHMAAVVVDPQSIAPDTDRDSVTSVVVNILVSVALFIWSGALFGYYYSLYLRRYILTIPADRYASNAANIFEGSQLIVLISFLIHRMLTEYLDLFKTTGGPHFLPARIDPDRIPPTDLDTTRICRDGLIGHITAGLDTSARATFAQVPAQSSEQRRWLLERYRAEARITEATQASNRETDSARIEALIRVLSGRIGMRYEDACEHLFQFSPLLFRTRSIKHRRNVFSLLDLYDMDLEPGSHDLVPRRARRLLEQNERFHGRLRSMLRRQVQNIAFHPFHTHVSDMASTHSSSDAVKIYFSALSHAGDAYLEECRQQAPQPELRFAERLKYLYYKSNAHVGLSVHYTAHRIAAMMKLNQGLLEHRARIVPEGELDAIITTLAHSEAAYMNALDRLVEALTAMKTFCTGLRQMNTTGIAYMDLLREGITQSASVQDVKDKVLEWVKEEGTSVLILTFAFSKNVRDILHEVFTPAVHRDFNRCTYAVLLLGPGQSAEAVRIKFMSTDKRREPMTNAHITRMTIADADLIASLLTERSRILVVLGADAVDDSGRFLKIGDRRRRFHDFMAHARKQCGQQNVRTLIVAESFKYVTDLAQLEPHMEDHYHSMDAFKAEQGTCFAVDDHAVPCPSHGVVRPIDRVHVLNRANAI